MGIRKGGTIGTIAVVAGVALPAAMVGKGESGIGDGTGARARAAAATDMLIGTTGIAADGALIVTIRTAVNVGGPTIDALVILHRILILVSATGEVDLGDMQRRVWGVANRHLNRPLHVFRPSGTHPRQPAQRAIVQEESR